MTNNSRCPIKLNKTKHKIKPKIHIIQYTSNTYFMSLLDV